MNKEKTIGDLKFEIELAEAFKETETYEKKNSEIKERKNVKALGGYFVIATLYFMMGLHAINQTLNFGEDMKIVLIETIVDMSITMILVGFAFWIITLFFKYEEYQLEELLVFSLILTLLVYLDSHYLNSGTIKSIISEHKYFYYLIILPANAIFTVKLCMALETKWSLKNNLLGFLCFIIWNLFMEYVVATQIYIAYHGMLVFTNVLIAGAVIFNAKTKEKHNGNRIAMTLLYFVLMLGSLYLKKASFVSIREFLFDSGNGFQEYVASVQNLLCNSKMIGCAFEGYSWELVNLLDYSSATIQSLIGYFGIIPAGIYILLMVAMLIIFGKTLYQIKDKDREFYMVGMSACSYLTAKTILGVCYELALLPLKILMPFSGENKLVDFCCCAMLLIIYFDNKHDEGYIGPFDEIKNTLIQKIIDFYTLENDEIWEEEKDETID